MLLFMFIVISSCIIRCNHMITTNIIIITCYPYQDDCIL